MAGKPTTPTADSVDRRIELATAQAWRPEPGDRLTGVLAQVRKQEGGIHNGQALDAYPVFIFDTVTGAVAVHAYHQTLIDGLKDVDASKGHTYTLAYVGDRETNASKKAGATGTPDEVRYHLYVVMSGDGTEDMVTEDYDDWKTTTE